MEKPWRRSKDLAKKPPRRTTRKLPTGEKPHETFHYVIKMIILGGYGAIPNIFSERGFAR
jgi:hypothetical protein